ncbi:MAG: hypothetical protein IT447_11900 [Phycisphaerales bacterium]|jgi:hypothetical protein|nr:hypothetical protein [Phycisphaerales bacterium]
MLTHKRPPHRKENALRHLQPAPLWSGGPRFTSIESIDAYTWDLHLDSPCRIDESKLGGILLGDIMSVGATGQMEPADAGGILNPDNVDASLADPMRLRLNRLGGMPAGILSLCIYGPINWLRSIDNGAPAEGRRVDF